MRYRVLTMDDGGGCPVSVEPWGAAAIPATTDQTFPGRWSTRHQFLVAMSAIRRIGGDRWMEHPSNRFSHRIEREGGGLHLTFPAVEH